MQKVIFEKAIPVWAKNEDKTLNYRLAIKTTTASLKGCKIKIGANSFYRLEINGKFVSFGPARTARGYARIDEISLDEYCQNENEIIIYVAGYNNKSLSTVKANSFVVCEILNSNGEVVAFTGKDFVGFCDERRVQKVERFSMQRHFGEVYDERKGFKEIELAPTDFNFVPITRVAPYPEYTSVSLLECERGGTFAYDESLPCKNTRYSSPISFGWGKFDESEIEYLPYRWVQKQKMSNTYGAKRLPITLNQGEYVVFDFKKVKVGFLNYLIKAVADSEVTLAFSEMRLEGEFHFQNANMHTVIHSVLPNGFCGFTESFEPYSFRYVAVFVKSGKITLEALGVTTFAHFAKTVINHEFKNKTLEKIFIAGVNTFIYNAVDLYTDCPSRERAGWLCDSYFTAKAEAFLFNESRVEQAFLENYALYENNGELPQGVLPMCFPADVGEDGNFIPQWNMWLVLQIVDYVKNRNGTILEQNKKQIFDFMAFLAKYENEFGLLENLPAWNFVEWSSANEWTKDVNYPTNFLYSQVLQDAGELLGVNEWKQKAQKVRETTRRMAFDGRVFVDHAIRKDGKLINLTDTSEAGQYYAALFGQVLPTCSEYEWLFDKIFNRFEPMADRNFVNVNAFIGFYLRMLTLVKFDKKQTLKCDILEFFSHMEELTGTLWEYKQHKGSYNHGFASLVCEFVVDIDKMEN